jgi:hypothetical protein
VQEPILDDGPEKKNPFKHVFCGKHEVALWLAEQSNKRKQSKATSESKHSKYEEQYAEQHAERS